MNTHDQPQAASDEAQPTPVSAGALLRQLRESANISIEDLARQLRVSKQKLLLLEQEQWGELPDIVFVRALALSVCRFLQVDASQVLALLPQQVQTPFHSYDARGLNSTLRRPTFSTRAWHVPRLETRWLKRIALLAVLVGLIAAAWEWAPPIAWGTSSTSTESLTSVPSAATQTVPQPPTTVQQTSQGPMVITTIQPGVALPVAPVSSTPADASSAASSGDARVH